jgi:hypothetical protein
MRRAHPRWEYPYRRSESRGCIFSILPSHDRSIISLLIESDPRRSSPLDIAANCILGKGVFFAGDADFLLVCLFIYLFIYLEFVPVSLSRRIII